MTKSKAGGGYEVKNMEYKIQKKGLAGTKKLLLPIIHIYIYIYFLRRPFSDPKPTTRIRALMTQDPILFR